MKDVCQVLHGGPARVWGKSASCSEPARVSGFETPWRTNTWSHFGSFSDHKTFTNWRKAHKITLNLSGLKRGFTLTPVYQPDCSSDFQVFQVLKCSLITGMAMYFTSWTTLRRGESNRERSKVFGESQNSLRVVLNLTKHTHIQSVCAVAR